MTQAKPPLFLHNLFTELLNIYGPLKYTKTFQLDPTHRWWWYMFSSSFYNEPPSTMMRAPLHIPHLINLSLHQKKYTKIRRKNG